MAILRDEAGNPKPQYETATVNVFEAAKGSNGAIDTNVKTISAGTNVMGKVGVDQTTDGTTNRVVSKISQVAGENVITVDGIDGTGIVQPTGGSGSKGWLSGIYDRLAKVVLAAGTAIIGKVGIDQTTPGVTSGVSIVGSLTNKALSIVATPTEQTIVLPSTTNNLIFINDGTTDINFALNGNSAFELYDDADPTWTYIGTWTISSYFQKYGTGRHFSSVTNDMAIFKSAISGLQSIAVALITGIGSGIAKIEISSDNGVTWVNPSTVIGITRSDSATGTGLDSFDAYTAADGFVTVTYRLPYNQNKWALRLTVTGTKNASATNYYVLVDAGIIFDDNVFTSKAGESLALRAQTSIIKTYSATGSQNARIVVY